jgi:DNA-binding transcriptional LysR family regulator
MMELRWLQDFLMVAETGNFTRAAEKRNTSQAAFSRRIKSLEAWLGFDLIDRSVYPTQLTPQGERFREHAGELLRQMLDSRLELGGKPLRRNEHIRIALPFAMATARLPHWWQAWSQDRRLSCSVVVGNIHDLVTSLVSDNVDLMICYHHAQQPIHLDPDLYERVTLGTEFLRPYASEALVAKGGASLPGRASHPVRPRRGLVNGTVAAYSRKRLTPIGGDKWALPLSLVAFRGRMHDGQRALNLFWSELCRHSAGHAGSDHKPTGARSPAKLPAKLLRKRPGKSPSLGR